MCLDLIYSYDLQRKFKWSMTFIKVIFMQSNCMEDNAFIFENYSRSELIWLATHQQPIFVLLIGRAKSRGYVDVPVL